MIQFSSWYRSPHIATGAFAALIGVGAIAFSEAFRDLAGATSFVAIASLVALSWWRRLSWLRTDVPPEAVMGALPPHAGRTALLVFGLSLAFQLSRWIVDAGTLGAKTGDDDEVHIFLGYQVLGYFDEPPVFAYRGPGWPLMIAGLLSVFGHDAIWSVGLYNRLLLSTLPPLLYLILGRFLREPLAIAAAALSLAMPYNEFLATVAVADLPYTAASLFSLFALVLALTTGSPHRWLMIAGLVLTGKTLTRITGLGITLASALAFLLASRGRLRLRLGQAILVGAPVVAALLVLSGYNRTVSGHFRPGTGGSIAFLDGFARYFSRAPDTPAVREIAALVPEVAAPYLFQTGNTVSLAQYRFTASGRGDVFAFAGLADRAVVELVRALPDEYVARLGSAALVTMLHPFDGLLPAGWRNRPTAMPDSPRLEQNLPACPLQYALGAGFKTHWCGENQRLRGRLHFRPPWLADLSPMVKLPLATLTRTLPNRIRLLMRPFYWGVAVFASLIYLLTQPMTRRLAILLMLPVLTDLAFSTLMLADNSAGARYMLYVYPAYLLAAWLGMACALQGLLRLSVPSGSNRQVSP
jgi:hypothetical protein